MTTPRGLEIALWTTGIVAAFGLAFLLLGVQR